MGNLVTGLNRVQGVGLIGGSPGINRVSVHRKGYKSIQCNRRHVPVRLLCDLLGCCHFLGDSFAGDRISCNHFLRDYFTAFH